MQNIVFYKNKSFFLMIVFCLISLALMFFNVQFPTFNVRTIFAAIVYPFQSGSYAVGNFFGNTVNSLTRINELERDLEEAKKQLLKYQENMLLFQQLEKENAEMQRVLEIKSKVSYTTTYARVIAREPNLLGDYFTIDKGFMNGFQANMPVVTYNTNGELILLGKTKEVSFASSKVELLTSHKMSVGVMMRYSGYVGILRGKGEWNQACTVDFIPVDADTFIGEEVVTSGDSEIYPKQILVGTIVGIKKSSSEEFFKQLYVKPAFNYLMVNDVFVIGWNPYDDYSVGER